MKPIVNNRWAGLLAAAVLSLLAACGGGGGDGGTPGNANNGTLRFALTDNPSCGYDGVFVTVEKLRVHRLASADDGAAGWHEIDVPSSVGRINLLNLTNGVLQDLGQVSLPAGTYGQVRLVLRNRASAPLANAIRLAGAGSDIPLTTPSAQSSGLKANLDMTVAAGQVADFVIDFDACKSIVKAGNSGKYLLKPVLTVIPKIGDAGQRIVGYIDTASIANGGATMVSAQLAGGVVKATPPDATTGRFVLYPVPTGTYDLVVASKGRTTLVMTGVPVTTTAATLVGSSAARIILSSAASNVASGVVRKNGATLETGAVVRASQTLSGGPTVELAAKPVDDDTGVYSFSLPLSSPRVAAYAPNLTSITFLPDATDPTLTAAGKYRLAASIPGFATQTADISMLAGDVSTPFDFASP
jgi:hypothetical protein